MFVDDFIFDAADLAGYYLDDEIATAPIVNTDIVTVGRCVVDKLYIEQGANEDISKWDGSFPTEWGWGTLMQAEFNDNLHAGSVNYSVDVVSELRIKRRKKGELRWKTIYVKATETVEDFQFSYYDNLAAGNTDYEYLLVPLISGEEGAAQSQSVHSEFRDLYLLDRDQMYHIILDATNTFQYNIETSSQTTIASKYPYVVKNGSVGYYSGSINATMIELVNCEWDVENGAHFRKEVDKFLSNDNVKVLKDWMGNIWLVSIIDAIQQDSGDSPLLPVHNFNWIECGDVNEMGVLYDNGFINTQIDRE